jgi:hypothetical protein
MSFLNSKKQIPANFFIREWYLLKINFMTKKHTTMPNEPVERPVQPEQPEIRQPNDPGEPQVPQEAPGNQPQEMPPMKPGNQS